MDILLSAQTSARWHAPTGPCAECSGVAIAVVREVQYWRRNGYASTQPEILEMDLCQDCLTLLDIPLRGVPACLAGQGPVYFPTHSAPHRGQVPERQCPRCGHDVDPSRYYARREYVGEEFFWYAYCCCCGQQLAWVPAPRHYRAYDEEAVEADAC